MKNIQILLAIVFLTVGLVDISFSQSHEVEPSSDSLDKIVQLKDGQTNKVELNKEYFKGYILDTKSILTSPLHWQRTDWIKASLVVGITLGLFAYDEDIQDWVQENRNDTTDDIAKFAKVFGDGKYTLPPLAILYIYGHFSDDEKSRRVALLSLESFVVSGLFAQAIKYTGHRHRPDSGDSSDTWDGPSFSNSNLSFPSGHAQAAFSIATVIASEYNHNKIIPILAYGLATLTAMSRVNDNAHWASDAFFGSAIGYFTAKAILHRHEEERKNSFVLLPLVNSEYAGLLLSYRF